MAAIPTGPRLQSKHFVDDTLVRPKSNGVAEKTGYRAEITSIRTTASRFERNQVEALHSNARAVYPISRPSWQMPDQIELLQIELFPGYVGILHERWLDFFPLGVSWRVDLFQLVLRGILNNLRPRFVCFSKGDGIRMARVSIASQRFAGNLRHMWASHDNLCACRTYHIRHVVGANRHPRHETDSCKPDVILLDEKCKFVWR